MGSTRAVGLEAAAAAATSRPSWAVPSPSSPCGLCNVKSCLEKQRTGKYYSNKLHVYTLAVCQNHTQRTHKHTKPVVVVFSSFALRREQGRKEETNQPTKDPRRRL